MSQPTAAHHSERSPRHPEMVVGLRPATGDGKVAPSPQPAAPAAPAAPHYYYPAEGFGNLYRRVITNDFFADLIHRTGIRSVAELPLDSYGIVGAGSLIFTQLGCEVTLICDDLAVLDRARALMRFNGVSNVHYECAPLDHLSFPDDAFDLTWSFDRLQAQPDPAAVLAEVCRVSKATLVSVPNASNYGQYLHWLYHRLTGTTCEYVGPRRWMAHAPLRAALERNGMTVVDEDFIDVPWWPGFPELPNLARRLLGRPEVAVDHEVGIPEASPDVVPPADVPALRRRVARAAVVERGRFWPRFVRSFFAHNLYVVGCKPRYRSRLGLHEAQRTFGRMRPANTLPPLA